MCIGKNNYRYKKCITDYADSIKTFFTTRDIKDKNGKNSFERFVIKKPDKIYGIRLYELNDEEKFFMINKETTVVVKTDSLGNVMWENSWVKKEKMT